jgi:hypothetical protein
LLAERRYAEKNTSNNSELYTRGAGRLVVQMNGAVCC